MGMWIGRWIGGMVVGGVVAGGGAGCAYPEYQRFHGVITGPMFSKESWGYTDVPVRPGYYEVGFQNRGNDNPTQARYYATVRAAELAVEKGKQYFEVVQASPGETPHTWAAVLHPGNASSTELAAIDAVHNTVNLDSVNASLLVRLMEGPGEAVLSAREVLAEAQGRGVKLGAAAEKFLATGALGGGPTP